MGGGGLPTLMRVQVGPHANHMISLVEPSLRNSHTFVEATVLPLREWLGIPEGYSANLSYPSLARSEMKTVTR